MKLSTEQRHTIDGLYRSLDADDTGTAVSVIVKTRGETWGLVQVRVTGSVTRPGGPVWS
ncbi:hypothetical protein Slala04_06830 [Streptomyces lavendulae subsp. lavendulae]|uniref:hypothetical protein n=1 Tax=Streptomyces sp. XY593 TaxID=1519483 RepID=UPI000ADCBF8D|nr:hypothetical protein [Streptomyces sp. XY593]GLV89229.1 hypothetical protein Slala04_06830 [Streptomyces lavendulae subsp. lavendulae]